MADIPDDDLTTWRDYALCLVTARALEQRGAIETPKMLTHYATGMYNVAPPSAMPGLDAIKRVMEIDTDVTNVATVLWRAGVRMVRRDEDDKHDAGNAAVSEIVKVQLPLHPMSDGAALIYDRERRHMLTRPLSKLDLAKMPRGERKAFFNASWNNHDGWVLLDRAPEQIW
jgi:hypothetical protein